MRTAWVVATGLLTILAFACEAPDPDLDSAGQPIIAGLASPIRQTYGATGSRTNSVAHHQVPRDTCITQQNAEVTIA